MSTLEKIGDYTKHAVAAQFEEYKHQNPALFHNRVVLHFFEQEKHQKLLLESMRGEAGKEEELNEAFRKYFFQFRFVTYVTSSLKFMSIDQMRRNQRYAARNVLIYDRPSSDESSVCIGETMSAYQTSGDILQSDERYMNFQEGFVDEQVEVAFESLTDKQKHVTTLYYGQGYHDHEIANRLQVSQQAIAKTRNTALKKMKTLLEKGVSNG
ncbi:sigma-70 family RNA polymerase sigma factor [Paenibacillus pabuli]|uniref:sigma-70 family RNA polymerase sigma factor n=1 Tax=Paenibacillus pabuli TaxID=1472 RepID=UPI00078236BD|nr:sigma-70 family RNA polymerase sigma factor [Paenibacillus pabuli]MEC0123392.1 sigma-70 family RNA polymerase sigma factor [Paenibacillus pabuli]